MLNRKIEPKSDRTLQKSTKQKMFKQGDIRPCVTCGTLGGIVLRTARGLLLPRFKIRNAR